MNCLICQNPNLSVLDIKEKPLRRYLQCSECRYLFMDPHQRLDLLQESARYSLHQNQDTLGYRKFFEPLITFIQKYRKDDDIKALDFGCGPEPVLAHLLATHTWDVQVFDPQFFPYNSVLQQTYDLVACTEVWEHLRDPLETLRQIKSLLRSGGVLAVMTSAYPDQEKFRTWSYRRDLTHIGFFNEITMRKIAGLFQWELVEFKSPYWIFRDSN